MQWRPLNVFNKEWLTGELLDPMARAARLVEGYLEGILAQLNRGLMTVFMEGLNSRFSAVKRKARGYRTVGNMSAVLYLVDGKLTQPAADPLTAVRCKF